MCVSFYYTEFIIKPEMFPNKTYDLGITLLLSGFIIHHSRNQVCLTKYSMKFQNSLNTMWFYKVSQKRNLLFNTNPRE
jgi:hypothetical protein